MKIAQIVRPIFLVALAAASAFAQDTLKANADSVTHKFENDRVRVLESTLRVGAKENTHSHPREQQHRCDCRRPVCLSNCG